MPPPRLRTLRRPRGALWFFTAILAFACPRAPAQEPVPLALEIAAEGLDLPVFATAPRGDPQRLFVCELYAGTIRIVKDGQLLPEPFLDLSGQLLGLGERGLLSMAFHPDYASNGRFFVFFNRVGNLAVVASFRVDPRDPDRALPAGTDLLVIPHHYPEHNGGMLRFGPDGLLYVTSGDGGGPLDPEGNGQDLSTLLGKLLRIDVDRGSPYAIPATNPFVGVPGARPEILAYGLRNPWRMDVDPVTGVVLLGDVGADSIEEIDAVPAGSGGQNFGWRCREGTLCTGLAGCACEPGTYVDPIFQYTHAVGCAVIGGVIYRGEALRGHQGRYLFSDFCNPAVFSFAWTSGAVTQLVDHSLELVPPDGAEVISITSFGLDGAGEPLFTSIDGRVYRIVPFSDCDGDGVGDQVELATGSAFDADDDGQIDACAPGLVGAPLVPGDTSWLWFTGATPGQPVAFCASVLGVGHGPCLFGGAVCLDLAPFPVGGAAPDVAWIGGLPADAQGTALLPLAVPVELAGLESIAFQAVALAGAASVVSPPLTLPVLR